MTKKEIWWKGDLQKLNDATEELAKIMNIADTSITLEDEVLFHKNLERLENVIKIAESIKVNRIDYDWRNRIQVEQVIIQANEVISNLKCKWIAEVQLPNAKTEEKPALYRKYGENLKEFAEVQKKGLESEQEYPHFIDEALSIFKNMSLNAYFATLSLAHRQFYKAKPNDEDAKLAIKYHEKFIKLQYEVAEKNTNAEDIKTLNMEKMEEEKELEEIKKSKETLEKWIWEN